MRSTTRPRAAPQCPRIVDKERISPHDNLLCADPSRPCSPAWAGLWPPRHPGHVDYPHDGHLHHPHEGHIDEHVRYHAITLTAACRTIAAAGTRPAMSTAPAAAIRRFRTVITQTTASAATSITRTAILRQSRSADLGLKSKSAPIGASGGARLDSRPIMCEPERVGPACPVAIAVAPAGTAVAAGTACCHRSAATRLTCSQSFGQQNASSQPISRALETMLSAVSNTQNR
jgi:hypothetical protein